MQEYDVQSGNTGSKESRDPAREPAENGVLSMKHALRRIERLEM
jgi:hypothetical protein